MQNVIKDVVFKFENCNETIFIELGENPSLNGLYEMAESQYVYIRG